MLRAQQPMLYREFEPGPRVQSWVASYWHFRVNKTSETPLLHTIPLTGAAMFAVCVSGHWAAISGPRTLPLQVPVQAGDEFWGAHFVPGAAEQLMGRGLRDAHLPAEQFAPSSWIASTLARFEHIKTLPAARKALDCSLRELAMVPPVLDPQVLTSVGLIVRSHGALPISEVAAAVGLSERQLLRRFRATTGLTPKEFARVRRTRAALVDAARTVTPRWCEIALERGFADQAHLITEFRRTLGTTPRSIIRHVRRIRHGRVLS